MSLDKAIAHAKEKRKPYRGAKAVDATCRNHGSCPHCRKKVKHKRLPSRRQVPEWVAARCAELGIKYHT